MIANTYKNKVDYYTVDSDFLYNPPILRRLKTKLKYLYLIYIVFNLKAEVISKCKSQFFSELRNIDEFKLVFKEKNGCSGL